MMVLICLNGYKPIGLCVGDCLLGIGGAFGEAKKRSKAFNNMLDRLAL
jgi:hypothetical protein